MHWNNFRRSVEFLKKKYQESSVSSLLKREFSFCRHSFGYECIKRDNLHVLDKETLLFATGNLIHFLDIPTKSISFRKSANGAGISCVTVRIEIHILFNFLARLLSRIHVLSLFLWLVIVIEGPAIYSFRPPRPPPHTQIQNQTVSFRKSKNQNRYIVKLH